MVSQGVGLKIAKMMVAKKKTHPNRNSSGKFETNQRVGEEQSYFILAESQQKIVSLLFSINRIKSFLVFRRDMCVGNPIVHVRFLRILYQMLWSKSLEKREKNQRLVKKSEWIRGEKHRVEEKATQLYVFNLSSPDSRPSYRSEGLYIIVAENDKDRQ